MEQNQKKSISMDNNVLYEQTDMSTGTVEREQEKLGPRNTELSRQFIAQAGANFWGTWYTVYSHTAGINITIAYRTDADTTVLGKVRYCSRSEGRKKEQEFIDEVNLGLCDGVMDVVEVCFKGSPFGAQVTGTVWP
ncbi:hypothetical protein [Bacillus sp. CECT 9360]|uniref:hypothetical protein n=1 Tax=Bacillus sp. CECT 9360 TaxID=2845821 RepID=UPI001E34F417|nr:hypothetical protein [Bacillus sp. CECT 9360]CAH0347478.1 hypothetical protein BCI9360_03878 [Bacillus sp. CECT 9360]